MNWGFDALPAGSGQAAGNANAAPDLEAIETEQLGFQAVGGERKLRLFPTPWPSDALPITTASLLSVASQRGLIAAAGPDTLVVYDTDSIREALQKEGGSKVENAAPKSKTSIPRVSHLAFSSDESSLIITAEDGGGLAVYDVNTLGGSASPSPSFQLATNGVSVRHLLPNPGQDFAHIVGIVLTDGKLLIADLKERKLLPGSRGDPILKENVSCASWSQRGKQIVAGLADGTAVQLDTQGNQKEAISRPPQLLEGEFREQNIPVTSIYWLGNLDFFIVHTPVVPPHNPSDGMPPPNDSVYHLVHRDQGTKACSYHRFSVDPCPAFMDQRIPAYHFIRRLRDWQPHLDDTIVLASTASADVGVITRSTVPLSQDLPAEQITNTYTTTSFTDTRRAALPTSVVDEMSDTSPIGVVVDLSSKQKVPRPIPNDETLDESSLPLPQLCVLNQEGLLSSWWYVYNEGVRQNKPAPGLIAANGASANTQQPQQPPQPSQPSQPAQGTFGSASPFAQNTPQASSQTPAKPAFGQPTAPAFGQPSAPGSAQPSQPTFGSTSNFGSRSSPWGNSTPGPAQTPSFGKPSFGAPSQPGAQGTGSAFGEVGGMGASKPSLWGTPPPTSASPQTGNSTFGQPSQVFGGNSSAQSPFAAVSKPSENAAPGQSPFASKPSPFAAAAKPSENAAPGQSPFASKPSPFAAAAKSLGNAAPGQSPFASKPSPFAAAGKSSESAAPGQSPFAGKPSPFAAFSASNNKASPFASAGQNKPGMPNDPSFGSTVTLSSNAGSFGSGATFGQSSSWAKVPSPKEETMGDDATPKEEEKEASALGGVGGFKLGSTFKSDGSAKDDLPKPKEPGSNLFGLGFGNALNDTAKQGAQSTPPIKQDPESAKEVPLSDIPEAPAVSSPPAQKAEEAPLPPDFVSAKPKDTRDAAAPAISQADAPLPPDFLGTKGKANKDEAGEVPIAGSPPVDVGGQSFAQAASQNEVPAESLPEDAGEEELDEEEEEEEAEEENDDDGEHEEGEDEDDDEDEWEEGEEFSDEAESEENHTPVIENPQRLSAFESRLTPASPKRPPKKKDSTTPETAKKPSFTPAGFPKAPLHFSPPKKEHGSPRSPSPMRGERAATSPMRLGAGKARSPAPSPQRIAVAPPQKPKPADKHRASLFAQPPPEPEAEDLEDEEDERTRQILEAPIEPTKDLSEFIAHQNYTGGSEKSGIAGQLEKVYRDVNSMVDTLGLNARALQAFIDGHSKLRKQGVRNEGDLEDDEAWCLGDLGDLERLQITVDDKLEEAKIEDVNGKLEEIGEEDREMGRVKAKSAEVRKQIALRTDAQRVARQQNAPLPPETAAQQAELRQNVQHVQKLLSQVEENMSLLRVDLTSVASTSSGSNGGPSVEAVINTILKMTSMIEQKSGDIDVLEAQIKRLTKGASSLNLATDYEDKLASSMAGSKLSNGHHSLISTPPPKNARARMAANGDALGMSGMFGSQFQTPPSVGSLRKSLQFNPSDSLLGRSRASVSGSARKKMTDVTDEEVEAWHGRLGRRRKVLAALRRGVEESATKGQVLVLE